VAEHPVVLVYRAHPGARPVSASSIDATIGIMRERLEQLGVAQPEIRRLAAQEIVVTLPNGAAASSAREVVGKTAQLDFYDWEPNVLGPRGTPAPTVLTVTGGPDAGAAQYGLPEYQAVLRAAKRVAIMRKNDTTLSDGCTPAQKGGCRYGSWYLLDTEHKRVLAGPEATEQDLYANSHKPLSGPATRAARIEPGTVLVQARRLENANGKIINASPNSWYVLNDDPVLSGPDIKNPRPTVQEQGAGQPVVSVEFTSSGGKSFEQLTRTVAHRGLEAQLPGVSRETAEQHFAIVLDNQLITVPSIDFTKYPEGIDATNGSEIAGNFTFASAGNLADELRSGALPVELELIPRSRMPDDIG
jgi:SecD/SecF fusion protein